MSSLLSIGVEPDLLAPEPMFPVRLCSLQAGTVLRETERIKKFKEMMYCGIIAGYPISGMDSIASHRYTPEGSCGSSTMR